MKPNPSKSRSRGPGLLLSCLLVATAHAAPLDPNVRAIVGYWHNFSNGSKDLKLTEIPENYNVVNVAFLQQVSGSTCATQFKPYATVYPDSTAFIADIATLRSQGRKVLLSLGGQNGHILLTSQVCADTFVRTTLAILRTYGFDGLDIDLEGASLSGVAKTASFADPGTPAIVNLMAALDAILAAMGTKFWLTAAPEVYYVQSGIDSYVPGGLTGAYLPVLYHLRDRINILYPQLYNGSSQWTTWGTFAQSSPDFMTFMCDLLIKGFATNNGSGARFPGLLASQVAIGKPATTNAAGSGYSTTTQISQALEYLVDSTPYAGAKYPLSAPHPAFRGVMTWSINWDATQNYAWSKAMRTTLDGFGSPTTAVQNRSPLVATLRQAGRRMHWTSEVSGTLAVRDLQGRLLLETKTDKSGSLVLPKAAGQFLTVNWVRKDGARETRIVRAF